MTRVVNLRKEIFQEPHPQGVGIAQATENCEHKASSFLRYI